MVERLLHPLIAFACGGIVALYAVLFFDGAAAHYRLWYYTPAALVAGALAVDRFSTRRAGKVGVVLDLLVAAICLSRPLFGWPAASGHAIFFVYALLTAASNGTRVFAVILGVVTLYAKAWLWHWDMTLWPGLVIGLMAGWIFRRAAGGGPGRLDVG